jgi:phytoene dehydrogenase-like protein
MHFIGSSPFRAPDGCEIVCVSAHTPYLRPGQDWSKIVGIYRELVVGKLERMGLRDFSKHVRVEHSQTPADLERLYHLDRGAVYGRASHGRLSGGFKPAQRSKDFKNLTFAGGSVNPGPGVSLSLMSGQIAADCVLQDLGSPG